MQKTSNHPRRSRARAVLGPAAALLVPCGLVVAACGGDEADPAAVPELGIIARDGPAGEAAAGAYSFDVPDRLEAGAARLSLDNEGDEAHHAQLFRLDDGATADDLAGALATGDPAAALAVGAYAGGTGLVAPGSTSQADAVVDLSPGSYALLCFVAGPTGAPHVAHGMLHPFEVAAAGDRVPVPEADVEVDLVDFAFTLPDSVPAHAVVEVTNSSAAEMHELVVARLDDGASVDDVADAVHDGEPPPATPVGGVQAIPPGATQHLQLDLERGRYVVMCHVPSPDGTPHIAKGMIDEVSVT